MLFKISKNIVNIYKKIVYLLLKNEYKIAITSKIGLFSIIRRNLEIQSTNLTDSFSDIKVLHQLSTRG